MTARRLSRRRFLGWLGSFAVAMLRPAAALAGQSTVQVICRRAWGARRPTGLFRRHRIRRLTVHHSGVALRDNRTAPDRFRSHQAAHQSRGWPDIAYHLLIDRNGNVYEGRPRWAVGDTATNYDPTGHLLVLCEGNFDEQRPSDAQLDALADVLAWATRRYGVGVRMVRGHSAYADTACPGDAMERRLAEVRRSIRARLATAGSSLVELCGAEGRRLVEEIEAGRS